ncbi:hypothetical protein H1N69_gp28 [Lactococcus phage phiQ1]|uniref:Uncharacterized protein n=1 Tax=Lactococcus phage phiQ1 TaxID=2488571 RepID=A0A455VJE4_9CAUD|nr:hypothetical protein H1N69_gp28 [Lactococcus phage phiQ1]BBI90362.1 putative uncharacterized protein [Lactococcus phage phiQ1]
MPNTEYLKQLKELLKLEENSLKLQQDRRDNLLSEVGVIQDYIKNSESVINNIERKIKEEENK